jgi:hypothetical protein
VNVLSATIGIYGTYSSPVLNFTSHRSRALLGISQTKAYSNPPYQSFYYTKAGLDGKRQVRFQLAPANSRSAILALVTPFTSNFNVSGILKWWNRPYRPLTRMKQTVRRQEDRRYIVTMPRKPETTALGAKRYASFTLSRSG